MSDAKDDKTNNDQQRGTRDDSRAPLTLKPRIGGNVASGTVKQSFSHGRSKTVVVETKRRIGTPPPGAPGGGRPAADTNLARPSSNQQMSGQPARATAPAAPRAQIPSSGGGSAGSLRQEELDRRARVVEAALQEQER